MKTRLIVLGVFFAIIAVLVNTRGTAVSTVHSEPWLETHTPQKVGAFQMIPGPDGGLQTYHMNPETVTALHAAATVCRIFQSGKQQYEVVVITSDRGESFHDPAGCFNAQKWKITEQAPRSIQTTAGPLEINGLYIEKEGSGRIPAAYFFRHAGKFYSSQGTFVRQLFISELLTAKRQEGYMFRIIAQDPALSMEQLQKFAGEYVSALEAIPQGG